ncbi:MAG TPA: prepilin peptidase [Bryobacteraceae bacterium]|jgi:leader peptidase (prepilin peptidase)/N-methyltransferase|nr:prepilin peptidase [Bryobacteraceae bacterium]
MTAELVLLSAVAGVFGLLFGSFLNVCIYRIPRDLSVVLPRSFCPECGHPIAAYDNIPLFSYVVLKGRCRACKKSIGRRYPLVEFTTAVLFALVGWRYGWTLLALKWAIFESLMVALFWIDFEEHLLPDELTLGGSLGGLILAAFVPVPGILTYQSSAQQAILTSLSNAVLAAVVLAGSLWIIRALYEKIRHREGVGLGDVKLLLLFGTFLGLQNSLTGLLIGSLGGSVIGIVFLIVTRKNPSTYQFPYGTFLCAGAALVPLLLRA